MEWLLPYIFVIYVNYILLIINWIRSLGYVAPAQSFCGRYNSVTSSILTIMVLIVVGSLSFASIN
jgi:hypothetical protein